MSRNDLENQNEENNMSNGNNQDNGSLTPRRYLDPFEGKLGQRIIEEKLKSMENLVNTNKERLDDNDNTDESQQQNIESLQENLGDLADVAFSGDYKDLDNKPTIPAAQVQADWDEADSSSMSYIANKPTIPAAQVQADWDESDSSSPAFIANKPFIPVTHMTITESKFLASADKGELAENVLYFITDTRKIGVCIQGSTFYLTAESVPNN